jgi:Spy/CpxP family protein refolding chaperone
MKLASMRRMAFVAGLGLSAAAAHAATGSAPAPAAPTDEAAAELREHHRNHNSGGVMKFVAMSLDTLGTADEGKRAQVAKLQGEMNANMAPAREAEKEFLQTLADGIATGAVDKAKVDAALSKVTSAATTKHDVDYDTLNQIHKILSPEERAALVDKVQAHYEVWSTVNQEAKAAGGRLGELTAEVGLTPDQVAKMSAALKARPATGGESRSKRAEARVHAFTTGFSTASFDAKSLASKTPTIAGRGSIRMAQFYETVTPLLTTEQRTKLAEILHEHASYEPASSGK